MYYRRKLPHWLPDVADELPLFVTWRLEGSVARAEISTGAEFAKWDRELDRALYGPVWLKDDRVARMVTQKLLYGESDRHFYELKAWVIMPNHVHTVIAPKVELPVIMRWLKGSTARAANLILGRAGAFWHAESFDHRVKDPLHLARVIRYVENNPVNAGFVQAQIDWTYSSAGWAGVSACPTL